MTGDAVLAVRPAGRPGRGQLAAFGRIWPCALGRGGISRAKREGDGATPAGLLRPMALLYRPDRLARPRSPLPAVALTPADGWSDDPADRRYNRPVRLPHPARHERLWRDDELYDIIVPLDWNTAPVRPGRGSAIFLHVARPGFAPTEGCIALARDDLLRLLERLTPASAFRVG